jgi:signal transduction histidine kinase
MPPTPDGADNKSEQIEHERLTSLINSMADAVIAVDEKANIVMYNSSALNILDVNNIETNVSLGSIFKPINTKDETVDIVELVEGVKVPLTDRDLMLVYGDGSHINLYVSIAPVRLGYGETGQKGYVILLRDITREKSLEEERDEFISVVSHELRTPIAIAEGYISNAIFTAKKANADESIQKSLEESHKQVLFLSDMMNDLSTLSRAERGVLQIDVEAINVHNLVNDLIGSYTNEAEKKGLQLKCSVDPSLELLYSSPLYVKEILQNFVTNALKYTHGGHIDIEAKVAVDAVRFSISDTGIGISKSDQERVFDKFFRSEDYRTREANGTGLGLYVTMKLARLIHAEISLESELNKGSTFSIYIPNLKQTKIDVQ